MGAISSIEWTDASWNPVRARGDGKLGWHCERVSPGCEHCYAERLNGRIGTGLKYTVPNRQQVELFLDEKPLAAPLRWRKPRKIFPGSMSDLFADFVSDSWLYRIFAVAQLASRHQFQFLTKRAKRAREFMSHPPTPERVEANRIELQRWLEDHWTRAELLTCYAKSADEWDAIEAWPPKNVWLGVSCEDQQRLDERVPELLATTAAVRFVSAEPLLGPLHFDRVKFAHGFVEVNGGILPPLDWVIVGGESGPGARPMDIAWAREIVRQCREAGVACFMKQLGRFVLDGQVGTAPGVRVQSCERLQHPKGGDPSEWPPDLRVREFPEPRA